MASMALSQSIFSTVSSQRFENVSFPLPSSMLKQSLLASRSHSLSTHFKKNRDTLITNCATPQNDSKTETPIELRYPAFPTVMDINQIRDILPHRFPFLLVDRVIEYNPGVSAVAIKNVTINDNFFPGHFPERPIMPGVLMIERTNPLWRPSLLEHLGPNVIVTGKIMCDNARNIPAALKLLELFSSHKNVFHQARTAALAMAQVGGLVMLQPEVGGSKQNFFFAGIDKVRFRKPVVAGDTLVMRMTLTKLQKRFGIAKMEGKAYVGGDVVCEGEFLMATGSE